MTRSTQLLMQAVSATKRRAEAGARPEPTSMRFVVVEDNAGGYRWTIVAGSGESLAQSSRFASYEQAERAARIVCSGAASARFDDRAGDTLCQATEPGWPEAGQAEAWLQNRTLARIPARQGR